MYTPKHLAEKILTSRSALEGERKQVTVLFCDIASSTTLAGRLGPDAMHELLNRFFELALAEVHKYEGTVNQFLGDGFMALFGAPLAHEDHARRAVLAALGVRRRLAEWEAPAGAELAVRMGLNTGLVVVGKIGDNLRMDYTAVGDTTHLAARLEQMAEPGTIVISETTRRLVQGYVRMEQLEPVQVKGKAEPVKAYRVAGLGPRRSPLEAQEERVLSRFVGRKRELATLRDLLELVEAGQGQVVGIVGEPGVGKSRVLYEFRQRLTDRPLTYLEGRCLSYGGATPYLPLQDIVRHNCGVTDADTPETTAEKVCASLQEVGMEADIHASYLLQLLGVKGGTERLAQVGPETIRARIFETLREMSLRGSRHRQLIMAIEDLHWVDKTSEEFLASAVESVAGARILWLTTYRPGYRPAWMDKSYATQIALRPLSAEDSQTVVQSVAQLSSLPASLEQVILSRAEGNPFFLEELTRDVLEHGELRPTLAVPDTIQGVLMARIDRLAEAPKRVLQTAAVLGREFSPRLLEAVWEESGDLRPHLAELKRLEFLYERTRGDEPVYLFKHALTQEVAYESVLTARRAALHEAAGRALESLYADRMLEHCEALAHHYSLSGDADKAIEYIELANQKAAKANAMEDAKAYFDRAMALLQTLPDAEANRRRCISLLVKQWIVFFLLYRYPEYYQLLKRHEAVAVQLGDPGLLGALYCYMAHCQWVFGEFDQAIETVTRTGAIDLCESVGNVEDAAFGQLVLEWIHLYRGDLDEVLLFKEQVLRKMKERFNLRVYAWAIAGALWAHAWLGRWEEAVAEGLKELRVAEDYSDSSLISFANWNISMVYSYKGDFGRAVHYGELAVKKAPTPADEAWAQLWLAWAWCRAGDPHRGVAALAALVPMFRATRFVQLFALVSLGEGYWLTGEYDKAASTLAEALEVARECPMKFEIASAHRLLAEVALNSNPAQAEPPLAAPHFERSIAILKEIKAANELALAYAGYGRLHKRQGRITEARDYLTRALEIFERLGTLIEPDKARAELAELPAA